MFSNGEGMPRALDTYLQRKYKLSNVLFMASGIDVNYYLSLKKYAGNTGEKKSST
jgi:hypothetical protein